MDSFENIIQIWDFPGGIHPPEHKTISNQSCILPGPLPKFLILPLKQHIGDSAKPCVNVGDHVLKGQKIAVGSESLSCSLHAPTSGTVVDIGLYAVQHASSIDQLCIKIETDGKDTWIKKTPISDPLKACPNLLIEKIKDAGIAGLGGAGFPTHAKYRNPNKISQLIINGVECEPYITADDRLMRERAVELIQGVQILAYILSAKEILIGIEDNKPEAISAIEHAIHAAQLNELIHCRTLPTRYPSGGEKQIIQVLTGKEVPSGKIPAELGISCQNIGTVYAVKRAIFNGEPLISRITTLTGQAIEHPGNYEVLIGTPIDDLLEFTNANRVALSRLVMGGPMMGYTLHNLMIPIVKSSNCIIAGTLDEFPEPPPEQSCIRCGECANVCPASLLPQQLYWFARAQEYEKANEYQIMDCIECGACAYVCPSHIPLVQYYRSAKGALKQHTKDHLKSDRARKRFEFRKERLNREKLEKEQKRKERARKAAATQKAKQSIDASLEKKISTKTDLGNTQVEQKRLQTQMATTQRLYREAAKALAHAEKTDAENLSELKEKLTQLKLKADTAKENWERFQQKTKVESE